MTDEKSLQGTVVCPICGYDRPHAHTADEQQAWREDQMRNDGWCSSLLALPSESGWYLCMGVEVIRRKDDSQHSWFLWVRDFMTGVSGVRNQDHVPEVLYYSRTEHSWLLRNALGNATYSGAENRRPVTATARLWRVVPAIGSIDIKEKV